MRAILVGGPLHGSLVPCDRLDVLSLASPQQPANMLEYRRRTALRHFEQNWTPFVFGDPTIDQLIDAISEAAQRDSIAMPGAAGDPV
jgi:hypothetical protein